MKKLLILTMLAVLLSSTNLFADCPANCTTCVSGTIINETWTVEGSPYCVEGDILVAGLTIEPGVRVEFLEEPDGDGYEFEVAGVLTAIGTKEEPIVFTKAGTNENGWQGIYFNYSNPGSILAYCTIEESINSGIRIINSLPTFENCTIANNRASQGGGINIDLSASSPDDELTLKNCIITSNTSSSHGGGIRANLLDSTLTLQGCGIIGNIANESQAAPDYHGGGIYLDSGNLSLSNCEVADNTCYSKTTGWNDYSHSYGGGIYSNGNLALTNCSIFGNKAWAIDAHRGGYERNYSYGGGVYLYSGHLMASNCVISYNRGNSGGSHPYPLGSGIYVNSGTTDIENCTIAYNENEGLRNASGTVTAINSICYFNAGAQISGTAEVTYSDVQDGYPGDGNINVHPIPGACLQILPGSLCIDAGNPEPQYNDVCLPPSLGGVRNDMGAHGGPGACEWIYCDGDFDCDVDIDGSDLAVFAADFGRTDCDDDCDGDFDNDGDVDGSDLAVFAANFGQTDCCPK